MRYDTPIYFQRVTAGTYDPETGDYGSDTVTEAARYAAVMDTRTETMQLVYGELKSRPVYRTFRKFYDYDAEQQKVLNDREPEDRFAGLKQFLREGGGESGG